MKRSLAAFLLFLATATTAGATATITCRAGNDVSAYIQIGSVAVPSVVGVTIEMGAIEMDAIETGNGDAGNASVNGSGMDRAGMGDFSLLSTLAGRGRQVVLMQSFVEDDRILLDLSDANLEEIVARLRLFMATRGDDQAIAGTLYVSGVGVFPLVCDNP